MDDWRIEGDEPKVQHRHDDGWVGARVEIDQTALEAAVCDCGADFGRRKCGPATSALANALLQLPQPFHRPPYAFEVRRSLPHYARDGAVVTGDDDLLAAFDAM